MLIYAWKCRNLGGFFFIIGRKFHFFHSFEPFFPSWGMAWVKKWIMGKEIWIEIPHPDLFPNFTGNLFPNLAGKLFPSLHPFHPFTCGRAFRSPKIPDFPFFQGITNKLGAPLIGSSANGILWKCGMGKIHTWNTIWVGIWLPTRSWECESRNSGNTFQPGLFHG